MQSNTVSPAIEEALMSTCQKPGLFFRGPKQGLCPFMA
jgi:hypothetical protein